VQHLDVVAYENRAAIFLIPIPSLCAEDSAFQPGHHKHCTQREEPDVTTAASVLADYQQSREDAEGVHARVLSLCE
jgi:hypothetical protein